MSEQIPHSNFEADQIAVVPSSYDYLFAPAPEVDHFANLSSTHEQRRDPRLELLFAPRLSRQEVAGPATPTNYNYLFEADAVQAEALLVQAQAADAVTREEYKKLPTISTEMKQAAMARLWEARWDPVTDAIVGKYEQQIDGNDPSMTVDALRTNADLRYELGSYYLRDKLPQLGLRLPRRVAINAQKRPGHNGYTHIPELRSREYAAMLALSMIDGTYDQPGDGDKITLDSSGLVKFGQHRTAAQLLLEPLPLSLSV